MIIALANAAGGVGKTSISVHLATRLAEQGQSVVHADCDAQQSSGEWLAEDAPDIRTVRPADPSAILDALPQLDEGRQLGWSPRGSFRCCRRRFRGTEAGSEVTPLFLPSECHGEVDSLCGREVVPATPGNAAIS